MSTVRCAGENEGMGRSQWSLTEWRRQRSRVEPPEPDSRGASQAGGGGGQGDSAQGVDGGGRSASLAEWRRTRCGFEPHEHDSRGAWETGGTWRRPCGDGEHTDGRWVAKAASEMAAEPAPCCQFLTPDESACGPRDARSETWPWVQRPVLKGRSDFLVQIQGSGCKCKGWVDNYTWEPARCALATWDAAAFCKALGGRSLMFVGDSTMIQAGAAFINAVHWDMWARGGGCQEQLSIGIASTLIGVRLGAGNRGGSWVELVKKNRPDVVVMSAGPHVKFLEDFAPLLDQVVEEHRNLFPIEVKLVWMTQPGTGCAASPLEAPPDDEFWARSKTQSHNWPLFPAFDRAARARFGHPAAVRENRFLLDVSPLALRADAHPGSRGDFPGDCPHACMPGPLDHFVPRTLLHLMLHHGI